jgi:DnaK suppressor protein
MVLRRCAGCVRWQETVTREMASIRWRVAGSRRPQAPARAPGSARGQMDEDQARARLRAEHAEVAGLLRDVESAGRQDRASEDEPGDIADSAQPLTAQGMDDAVAASLSDRLAALDRALQRLDDGTYGRSVRSGLPIPDERLDADPAAELTIEEARARP